MMGMDPGLLRERLTLQQVTRTPDGAGGHTESWAAVATNPTAWARVKRLPTGLRLQAMQADSLASHEVTIRYRSDVDAAKRWLWNGSALAIVSAPQNLDEHGEFLVMLCAEEQV